MGDAIPLMFLDVGATSWFSRYILWRDERATFGGTRILGLSSYECTRGR